MQVNQLAIGVFDSGMGGLTVLSALRDKLPNESFVYLGDTARLPYGTKSPDTVKQYAMQMARVLVERRIKALVIACNTATTAALPHLQQMLPDIPVLGVVSPGAAAAVAATKNHQIAVLATETTIASHAYQRVIKNQMPNAKISTRACSVLVALAEEGMVDNNVAREAIKYYLDHLSDEDTLLLGCTHYPVFKPLLKSVLPKHITLVDSAHATADSLYELLSVQHLINEEMTSPNISYLVTDSVKRFQSVGELFLGESLDINAIELIDALSARHV